MPPYFAYPSRQAPRIMAPAFAAFLLAGCAQTATSPALPSAPNAPSADYIAQGNEPFWQLKISGNSLIYSSAYGENILQENHNGPVQQSGTTRYASPRLSVTIANQRCDDTMIERSYRDTVTVVAEGVTVKGCGGPILPPAQLSGTNWEILTANGSAMLPEVPSNIRFDDGRISGTAGCNRFMGAFAASGESLNLSQIGLTRKACAAPLMEQERRVMEALGRITHHKYMPDGQLYLYADTAAVLTLRQIF